MKMAAAGIYFAIIYQQNMRERRRKNRLRLFQRHLRDMSNPFELPEKRFLKLFRLNKEASQYLIDEIVPHLHDMRRNNAVPNYLKILCALHFFGHGSYQTNIGAAADLAMSQPVVSRIISSICSIINEHLLNIWIQFPVQREDIQQNINIFFEKYRFPGTVGAVDGTHIAIIAPPAEHPVHPAGPYYNRKGFYSLNVQIIANAELKILNMNARFPGSVHDAAIFMMSSVNRFLKNEYLNGNMNYHIIGDEGYPLSPWVMVIYPGYVNPNSPEGRFNEHLTRARMTIERVNGVLKGRFRCLLKHRTLNYNPIKAAKITYACGVLHNIACYYNVPLPCDYEEIIEDDDDPNAYVVENNNFFQQGTRKRNRIANVYYN